MTSLSTPLLYSFRRCPYAIRARMAVFAAAIPVQLEEVSLKNKPVAMLKLSPKGTVPVLVNGTLVLDESLDIMMWALQHNDPDDWAASLTDSELDTTMQLITANDDEFKTWLDRYKYADRHPEHNQDYYRQQCSAFLNRLEAILRQQACLIRSGVTLADIAIFPFIRQFSMVDKNWFMQCPYPALRVWLESILAGALFARVMDKNPAQQIISKTL